MKLMQNMTATLAKIAQSVLNADNERVVNLRSVQWAKLVWHNQYNNEVAKPPKQPTYRTKPLTNAILCRVNGMPQETELERATRLGFIDEWLPVLYLQLTANHTLKYTGDKALSLWEAWKAKQYGKPTRNSSRKREANN